MIGLVDYDYSSTKSRTNLIPNLEIMKLAEYYKLEKNEHCRLLSLEEADVSNYDKIYFFSESHVQPQIPEAYLRASQVIYGGTAFTKGKYIPFENELIDYTLPKPNIYTDSLKIKYNEGVKANIISGFLDNSYYRWYGKERLPIPPIMSNKRIILYDRDFFYPDWREILKEIIARKPSSIFRIHPIVCHKLSDFFEARNFPKLQRSNNYILDLNIPLTEVYYMINKYKKYFLADITKFSNVYLPLGGSYFTCFQYYKDMVYKLNLLYCFWSSNIPIKIWYEPPFIGYNNPLKNLSEKIETWANLSSAANRTCTINERIFRKTKESIWIKERDLLLKFHPTAQDLFDQSYEKVSKGGRWRI